MKIQTRYETKLETANHENIGAILDAKLEATSPERVADYIAFGIDGLLAKIDRIKGAEADLKAIKAEVEEQIDIIKRGASKWLSECGLDSLNGDIISSVKVVTPKATEELIITTDTDTLINQGYFKTALDKTAIKNAILDGKEIEGAHIEVTHNEPTLTIYKKRKKNATQTD